MATWWRRWRIELRIAIVVLLIDLFVDIAQVHLGAPVDVRVFSNLGIFLSAIAVYFAVRFDSANKHTASLRGKKSLAEQLFK